MTTLALCIPAYNAESYLPRLLNSASRQSRPFDEIWVYDDCSSDATAEVARSHGARVVSGERNVGCSLAKDRLLRETTCDYVHFHDADDELCVTFVERAQAWMNRPDMPDIVLFGYEYRDHQSNEKLAIVRFDDAALQADAQGYCITHPICPFSGLYRRSAILSAGGYRIPSEQLYNEDKAFHLRMARAGLRFRADPEVLVINYRIGDSMSGAAPLACTRAQFEVLAEAARDGDTRHWPLVAARLWKVAGLAAAQGCWQTAEAAAVLAHDIDHAGPPEGHPGYRWVARRAPRLAVRIREWVLRATGRRKRHG